MNRDDFSILKGNLVYFDNSATTLKPNCVCDAIMDYYNKYTSNIHRGDYANSVLVSKMYDECRESIRKFINAYHSSEIIFTSGTTDSINMLAFGFMENILKAGDEILITESEHASNVLPWFYLAKKIGVVVKFIPLNEDNEVSSENLIRIITEKTKLVSIAHTTNVIGDTRNIKELAKICHSKNILIAVDAAQSIAHNKIDVQDMDIDFLSFSGHKMYGPTGVGVLYGKFSLLSEMSPVRYGGDMNAMFTNDGYYELKDLPSKLEAGTPNIEGVIGLKKAVDYINSIGIEKIHEYEHELRKYLVQKLSKLDFVTVYNLKNDSTTVIFNINGVFSQDTALYLDKYNICVRAGNHCAKLLKNTLNVSNTCRISLSFYNTKSEVDLLINVLNNSKNIWKEIL